MDSTAASLEPAEGTAAEAGRATPPPRGRPLAMYLVLLGLAIAIPALLFSGYLLYRFADFQRQAANRTVQDTASAIRDAVDREISAMTTTLRVLASSSPLETGDFSAFHARAAEALRDTDTYVILADPEGNQLLNTRVAFGVALNKVIDNSSVAQPLRTGRLYVSNVFRGAVSGRQVFNVAVPTTVRRGERAVLIMTRSASSLDAIISAQKLTPGWGASLIDSGGRVIASSGTEEAGDRSKYADAFSSFSATMTAIDGKRFVVAGRSSFEGEWRVAAYAPADVLEAPLRTSLLLLILVGLALVVLATAGAILFARRVSAPILALVDGAQALGHGEPVTVLDTPIREANVVSRALVDAAAERKDAEDQARFLMRELSHRAKNQLAVVVAMARRAGGDNEALREFRTVFGERLMALARSTDLLVEQNWKGVPLGDLLKAQLLPFETGGASRIRMEGPSIDLSADAAQNLGLALHELATNAAKYGALSVSGGVVSIRWWLTEPGPRFHITWTERGGPPVTPPESPGFGSTMIQRTVAQALNADVSHEFTSTGVVWTMELALSGLLAEKPG